MTRRTPIERKAGCMVTAGRHRREIEQLGEELLLLLRRAPRHALRRDRLASLLGTTDAHAKAAIRELGHEGYLFSTDRDTLSLLDTPDRLSRTEIAWALKTRTFGRSLHCFDSVGSTNTVAAQLAEGGAPDGTLVVCERQTQGRGRRGRGWSSPPGVGIWMSLVLRPRRSSPEHVLGLPLVAGLAWAQTVEQIFHLNPRLKWPNDGLLNDRKACGVLMEVATENDTVQHVICGMGINVNQQRTDFPASLRAKATSVALALGRPVDRVAFLARLLRRFETLYRGFARDGLAGLLDDYRDRSALLGRRVVCTVGGDRIDGTAVDVDEHGALIVRAGRRRIRVVAGEATMRE